jgi:tetratricopeptide (TPR) repeat protein
MTCAFQDMSHRSHLIAVLALAVWTMAQSPSAYAVEIEAAREQFKTGQYETCLKSAERAIQEGAYQTEWRVLTMQSLTALGRYDEAAKRIDTILKEMRPNIRMLKLAHAAYQHNDQSEQTGTMLGVIYRIATTRSTEYMSSDDAVALGESLLLLGATIRTAAARTWPRALWRWPSRTTNWRPSNIEKP